MLGKPALELLQGCTGFLVAPGELAGEGGELLVQLGAQGMAGVLLDGPQRLAEGGAKAAGGVVVIEEPFACGSLEALPCPFRLVVGDGGLEQSRNVSTTLRQKTA